jgi:type IV pilus assembly protein PilN
MADAAWLHVCHDLCLPAKRLSLPHGLARNEQNRQFVTLMVLAVIFTLAIVFLIHMNVAGLIDHQNGRNKILEDEIAQLEIQLLKIKGLEETKSKLLSRMDVIQSLQGKRPQIVHLFDQIVKTVPEGLHIKEIKQRGNTLTITGMAESNGRVSAYMRNIDRSDWMTGPELKIIETKREDGRGSEFTIVAKQSSPTKSEEDE